MKVRVLADIVINQISAGEVVERPASVVRELVDNAVDAGATEISVELEHGGQSLIKVSDDGCGMERDDALLAFERHATSKITSAEDLDAIATMGVSPVQYLLSPRLLASVLMVPLLCVLYASVGLAGAYLVSVRWLGGDHGVFLQSIRDFASPRDLQMGLVKAAVFGFVIAAISCRHGYFASGGARGVGVATTRAVVESCVTLLVVNYVLTQLLLEGV